MLCRVKFEYSSGTRLIRAQKTRITCLRATNVKLASKALTRLPRKSKFHPKSHLLTKTWRAPKTRRPSATKTNKLTSFRTTHKYSPSMSSSEDGKSTITLHFQVRGIECSRARYLSDDDLPVLCKQTDWSPLWNARQRSAKSFQTSHKRLR